MAAGGSPSVDSKAKKGPQVAHVPDTDPYPAPAGSPTSQFEPGSFAAVAGGKKASQSQHPGAPDGSGSPSFAAQKGLRGHVDQSAQFAASKGRSPKRSGGTKTPPATEAVKRGIE